MFRVIDGLPDPVSDREKELLKTYSRSNKFLGRMYSLVKNRNAKQDPLSP